MDSFVTPIVFIREIQPDWSFSEAIEWWDSLSRDEQNSFAIDVREYYDE